MKTIGFSMVLGNFQKINVFEKSMQKAQFWVHFGMPKPLKIDRKSCLKLMLVSIPFFLRFFLFAFMYRFWVEVRRSETLKINENHWFFNGFG